MAMWIDILLFALFLACMFGIGQLCIWETKEADRWRQMYYEARKTIAEYQYKEMSR